MITLKEATKVLMNVDRNSSTPKVIEQRLKDCWFKRHIPIPILRLAKDTRILRIRVINENQKIQFEDELSYPPVKSNTNYQRASTPDFNVFYGTSAPSYLEAFAGCLGETCSCFREHNPDSQKFNLVISEWRAIEDTKFVSFLNLDTDVNKSSIFKQMTPDFKNLLEEAEIQPDTHGITGFFDYLSSEFTKPTNNQSDYWVTSKTVEIILGHTLKYDGVVYESTQAVDEKLSEVKCFAVRPESIDSKFKFEKAVLYSIDYDSGSMKAEPKRVVELNITNRKEGHK